MQSIFSKREVKVPSDKHVFIQRHPYLSFVIKASFGCFLQTKSNKNFLLRHVRQIAKTPDKSLTSIDKPLGILRKAANVRKELHPQTKMVLHGRCATCFLSSKFQPLRRGHHSSPMSKTGSCEATADGFAGRFYEL